MDDTIYNQSIFHKETQRTVQRRIGEKLAAYILAHHFPNMGFEIQRAEEGYLYCKGKKDIFFSISHTEKYVFAAAADFPIGCDIELMKDRRIEGAKFFFSEEDYNLLLQEKNPLPFFYQLWTRKESFMKLYHCNIQTKLLSFHDGLFIKEQYGIHFTTCYFDEKLILTAAKKNSTIDTGMRIQRIAASQI